MRNRVLHDALRDFALEAAALLTDDVRDGAELEFDVVDQGDRRGPVLYRYAPRTGAFIEARWERLRELPACVAACTELGAGAATWLRVNGLRGEQAEPALRAMLERLYEDATSFGFPEERFERVYLEVETTLYRDAVRDSVVVPLDGAWMDADRIELGAGITLVRGDLADAPPEAVFPEDGDGAPALLCVLDRDTAADQRLSAGEAEARFRRVVTALRLWGPGAVSLGTPGWRRSDGGRFTALPLGSSARGRGAGWMLPSGDERLLREFVAMIDGSSPSGTIAWALGRFEMGLDRERDSEALSDYLLALRALLDATTEAGAASLGRRVAALCAEEDRRDEVAGRVEAALVLERVAMGGGGRVPAESPRELVGEVEGFVRALLRDVLCGYLDADLRAVADEILVAGLPAVAEPEPVHEPEPAPLAAEEPELEQPTAYLDFDFGSEDDLDDGYEGDGSEPEYEPEPVYEPEPEGEPIVYAYESDEYDTSEMEPVGVTTEFDAGVTPSADWDDPDDYAGPA